MPEVVQIQAGQMLPAIMYVSFVTGVAGFIAGILVHLNQCAKRADGR